MDRYGTVWEGSAQRQGPAGALVEGSGGSSSSQGPASSPASFLVASAQHQALTHGLAAKSTLGRA